MAGASNERVWLITGCATGFGALLAQAVLDRGERVVASDKDATALGHLQERRPGQLLTLQIDVTDRPGVARGVEAAIARFGRIDVLVNNAALAHTGPVEETAPEDVDKLFAVNVYGVLAVMQAVLPHMRAQGAGRIINISSICGRVGFPFQGLYSATKYAVEGFSECLSHEVASLGIHVSLVEPCGFFKTAMPAGAVDDLERRTRPDSPYRARIQATIEETRRDLEQAGEPRLVVEAVLELADAGQPPLRRPAGPAGRADLLDMRCRMPDDAFVRMIRGDKEQGD